MEFTLSKLGIFVLINLVAAAVAGTAVGLVLADLFAAHPLFCLLQLALLAATLLLFEVSYFKSVFGDPGRLTRLESDQLRSEDEIAAIRSDTATFARRLNSARKFVSLGGDAIGPEQVDPELVARFEKMSLRRISREMESIYLDFLDKRLECRRCGLVKPPRAHHCGTCGGCVRRMDHHCPWIANCVGEDNTRHFIQFTFYAAAGLAHCSLLILVFYVLDARKVS